MAPERSVTEKIREAMLAIKLEQEFGKDKILAQYLNTVYFGHGAYGIEAAAQTYFGKPRRGSRSSSPRRSPGSCTPPSSTTRSTGPTTTGSGATTRSTRWSATATSRPTVANELKSTTCCGTVTDAQQDRINAPGDAGVLRRPRPPAAVRRATGSGTRLRRRPAGHHDARPGRCSAPPRRRSPTRCPTAERSRGGARLDRHADAARSSRWSGGENWDTIEGQPRDPAVRRLRAARPGRRSSCSRWRRRCDEGYDLDRVLVRAARCRDPRVPRPHAPTGSGTPSTPRARAATRLAGRDEALGEHDLRRSWSRSSVPRRSWTWRTCWASSPTLARSARSRSARSAVNPLEMTNAYATLADRGVPH